MAGFLNGLSGWAWVIVYLMTLVMVPPKKRARGLITRKVIARIVPPKSVWRTGGIYAINYRYFLCWGPTIGLNAAHLISKALITPIALGVPTMLLLDDYLFGDDEWKKKWEAAKNKVKWLWLPEPARVPAEGR